MKNYMHDFLTEFKVCFLNIGAFGIIYTDVDTWLKILLSIVAIGYTLRRWVFMENDRAKSKKQKKDEKH